MERDINFLSALDMIYLAACAIHGKTPDRNAVEAMDLDAVYRHAARHHMQAVTATAMQCYVNAYGRDSISQFESTLTRWANDRVRAIRHTVAFAMERERICDFFEQNNIWYMPLKGVPLQEYYPAIGMRQMSDNDILYDAKYRMELRAFMLAEGYRGELLDSVLPDTYIKSPFAFEMHHSLYPNDRESQLFYRYYESVEEKLLPAEKRMERQLSKEDLYIYVVAHAYKHFAGCGNGVRSLMDTYVYLRREESGMDFAYINAELKKLGLQAFDAAQRNLAELLFSQECTQWRTNIDGLHGEELDLIKYYVESGVYGTKENGAINQLKPRLSDEQTHATGKFRYLFKRLFPDVEYYSYAYPWAYRCRILIPLAWLVRFIKGIFIGVKERILELKTVIKTK